MENQTKNSRQKKIETFVKTINKAINPVEYFAKLSDYGRKNSILLESADIVEKYGELSLGSADPCLKITGKGADFEIKALNKLGIKFIKSLKGDFDFCDKVIYKKDLIIGKLKPKRKIVSEEERLKLKTHADILRKIVFKFKASSKPFIPFCGLFGAISYDFIDQFEELPKNKHDLLKEPDYEFYYLDNLFLIDHRKKKTHIIANRIFNNNADRIFDYYIKKINEPLPEKRIFNNKIGRLDADTSRKEYIKIVKIMKEHILKGDIFQAVPSRTIISNYKNEPLDIYNKLKQLNPSPYMFYMNTENGIILGASPEMALRVQNKIVEIRPIAGTKPRGLIKGKIDSDLDARYESELKTDFKELAEHTMLVDLARNDVAKISKPGTRYCNEPYIVEKYSHVQHLVSNVKGILKDDLDALHAYLATMNMGTLTGAPKIEAMKLIRKSEKNKRGYYGGSVAYMTPKGDFDSTIIIRSIRIKKKKAYIRAGAGIVYDSSPEEEFRETEKKIKACLRAIGV